MMAKNSCAPQLDQHRRHRRPFRVGARRQPEDRPAGLDLAVGQAVGAHADGDDGNAGLLEDRHRRFDRFACRGSRRPCSPWPRRIRSRPWRRLRPSTDRRRCRAWRPRLPKLPPLRRRPGPARRAAPTGRSAAPRRRSAARRLERCRAASASVAAIAARAKARVRRDMVETGGLAGSARSSTAEVKAADCIGNTRFRPQPACGVPASSHIRLGKVFPGIVAVLKKHEVEPLHYRDAMARFAGAVHV